MRVLLVEPPLSPLDVPQGCFGLPEPLALEAIAAPMMANHDVEILDLRVEEGLEERLVRFDPHVVGVGAVTANLHMAEAVLRSAKQHNRAILTMIGGHHVSFQPEDCLKDFVDVIVIGEGEQSASAVVNAHERRRSFADISGLVINAGGHPHRTARAELLDLDKLAWPARQLVAHLRSHYFQRVYRPIVSLNSSRGCLNRCKHCTRWKMNHGAYRTRSAASVVDEMLSLDERFVDFIDDNSLEDVVRAERMAKLLIEQGGPKRFKLYARADTVARNKGTIERLAAAGLELMLVGFEACGDQTLGRWNKQSSLANNTKAIQLLQRCGIRIAAYFVVDPGFSRADFAALWNYVEKMQLIDPVFTILAPFPGSDLYREKRDEIVCRDYRLFDLFHTVFKTRLPLEEFYEEFALLYEKAYARERQIDAEAEHLSQSVREAYSQAVAEIMGRISALTAHHHEVTQAPARP